MHHPKKKAHEKELSRWINWAPNWKNSSYEIPLKIKKIAILIHLIQQPFEGFEKKKHSFHDVVQEFRRGYNDNKIKIPS